MLILEKMIIFLLLMLTGLLLAKARILDEHTSRKLSAIVIYVANPALIIQSSQAERIVSNAALLTAAGIAAAMYAVLIAVAAVLPKAMKLNQSQENAYALMTVFSNIGYMGIPLIAEIIGSSALLYVAVFIFFFNLLVYTYGVTVLQRGTGVAAQKHAVLRKVINPGVVSGIVAIALYLLHVTLPAVLTTPITYLSNLTAPVSMMVIGATLVGVKLRSFVTDGKLLAFSGLKLLALPILGGLLLKALIGPGDLLGVCIVMMSTPVASMLVMMSQQYGGDMTLLSKGAALTTILCIVTIPIVFAVLL
jgi:hypothetical protein